MKYIYLKLADKMDVETNEQVCPGFYERRPLRQYWLYSLLRMKVAPALCRGPK